MSAGSEDMSQSADSEYSREILSAQLPVTFLGTDFSFDELSCSCPDCDAVIPDEFVTGTVIRVIEPMAEIRAVSSCVCGRVTSYALRVRSDAMMQILGPDGWQPFDVPGRAGFVGRAVSYVRRFILGIRN